MSRVEMLSHLCCAAVSQLSAQHSERQGSSRGVWHPLKSQSSAETRPQRQQLRMSGFLHHLERSRGRSAVSGELDAGAAALGPALGSAPGPALTLLLMPLLAVPLARCQGRFRTYALMTLSVHAVAPQDVGADSVFQPANAPHDQSQLFVVSLDAGCKVTPRIDSHQGCLPSQEAELPNSGPGLCCCCCCCCPTNLLQAAKCHCCLQLPRRLE